MSAAPVQYRKSIDLARFAAAFGIVWAHAHAPGQTIGYLALSLFLVLTAFLSVQSLERSKGQFSWLARVQRIALPWLFWSLVFKVVNILVSDDPLPLLEGANWLLVGPSIHLWFLPFVMLASLTVPLLNTAVQTPRGLWVACAGLVLISPPLLWVQGYVAMPVPFPQWGFAFPPFLYGVVAALGHRQGNVVLPMATAALISAITFAGTVYAGKAEFWAVQVFLSAVVFEAVWRMDLRSMVLASLGRLAFGIYLVHPFFMLVAYKLFGGGVNAVFAAFFTFVLSMVATYVLRLTPGFRRMV